MQARQNDSSRKEACCSEQMEVRMRKKAGTEESCRSNEPIREKMKKEQLEVAKKVAIWMRKPTGTEESRKVESSRSNEAMPEKKTKENILLEMEETLCMYYQESSILGTKIREEEEKYQNFALEIVMAGSKSEKDQVMKTLKRLEDEQEEGNFP